MASIMHCDEIVLVHPWEEAGALAISRGSVDFGRGHVCFLKMIIS